MTFCMNMVLIDMVGDLGVNAFSAISYIASFSMAVFLEPVRGYSLYLDRAMVQRKRGFEILF